MKKEDLITLINENVYADHSGNLHNVEKVAAIIFEKIEEMSKDLEMFEAELYNDQIGVY